MTVKDCCSRSSDAGGVLVDAEDAGVVGELTFQLDESLFAQVAEAGVVVAAFGVVVVGDDRAADAGEGEDVETRQPVRRRADLVDLVDRAP